jgi:ABC-2 type transport system permease protein
MNTAVGAIVRKEFLQIRRDRRMLPIIFIAPVLQILVLGYAANFDVKDIRLAVLDEDRSADSRGLVERYASSGYFVISAFLSGHERIEPLLESGRADLVLVIPENFSRRLAENSEAAVQIIADGSDSNASGIGLNYAARIGRGFPGRLRLEQRFHEPVAAEPRVFFNPELKSRFFFVSGIFGLLLLVMTTLLTALALVKEKEGGTMEQLIVTPIRPAEIILGKLIPFVVIGFIDVCLILVAAWLLFGMTVKGSLALLLAFSMIFLLNTLGLGLLVSTAARTQQQAMMATVFFIMMPMIILSGFIFPIESMPAAIQYFTQLLPLRYFYVIVRGIILKGAGLAELWDEAAIMLASGLLIVGLSVARFRKRL